MNDWNPKSEKRKARPIVVSVPRMPHGMRRNMERSFERSLEREDRIREGALKSAKTMPKHDKERLRLEPNSDRIVKLEATRKRARSDIKRRLSKTRLAEGEKPQWQMCAGFWDFIFELLHFADSPRQAKAWFSLLLYNETCRARGKGHKTCKEVKALFDYLTEKRFLCYDKKTRLYSIAPDYSDAVRLMRTIEISILEELLRLKKPIRDR